MANPDVVPPPDSLDLKIETLIIGAGANGLVAVLAAREAGQDILLVEADPVPLGSTALSAGLIQAAGTRFQTNVGIDDSPDLFAADIQAKAHDENDPALVDAMARTAGPVIEWLTETHGLPWVRRLVPKPGIWARIRGTGTSPIPMASLITWATITEGGIQVNSTGQRFWNEAQGDSEAARAVLSQPGGLAWVVFDSRIAGIARQFEDFINAEKQGAVITADTLEALARRAGLPDAALLRTVANIPRNGSDSFGRTWNAATLTAPFCAVKVTGALFHTQGRLDVDPKDARVRRADGGTFPNLYAAGGAACGVSGKGDSGYLSGNGLLAAVTLGYVAGRGRPDAL